jgi:hypothetical protein
MDDLSVFRTFRHGVAAPSEDARRRASARLASAIDGPHRRGTTLLRPIRRRPGRAVLAMAALVGATAAALFVSTPWQSSPGLLEPAQAARFLERTQAALTPPPGEILHFKAEWSRTSTTFGCTVTGPVEMWSDRTPPFRFRRITSQFVSGVARDADFRTIVCSKWDTNEVGGDASGSLEFHPPNTLVFVGGTGMSIDEIDLLRAMLRDAIARGLGHDEGMTEIDGRAVRRFRLDCDPLIPAGRGLPVDDGWRCVGPSYVYVDTETFLPVQLEQPWGFTFGPFREGPNGLTFGSLRKGGKVEHFDTVWRYRVIEYLPRTEDNIALTDIRAQYPDARIERR